MARVLLLKTYVRCTHDICMLLCCMQSTCCKK